MRKIIIKIMFVVALMAIWSVQTTDAEVVIKVRALNPLDTQEIAVVKYPLPKEVSKENVLKQKITYSMDHSEDEEPPKTSFQITFDESKGGYYIDDEVSLLPKEVVTLEVHVEDVWVIKKAEIEELRGEVDGLLKTWEEGSPEIEDEEAQSKKDETKEFALMMKEEILGGLDKIIERQDANEIIDVGVEQHITAYKDSIDELRQVEQDIVLLANLIQFEGQESEGLEDGEALDVETQDSIELQTLDESEFVESEENIEL